MATYWENSCSFGLRYVSWYKYLIVTLFFSHLGFWSGNLFLIAPFPDLCLLVPFDINGLSQPPGGKRLLPFKIETGNTGREINYCAATAIFIVLLIIQKTIQSCLN